MKHTVNRRLTVLQVIPDLDAGGAERTTVDIARALIADGHVALVATAGGRMEDELRSVGGEIIRLPVKSKSPIVMMQNALALNRVIQARKVTLVHARSRAPAWSALWAARRNRVPFITTYHGTYSGKTWFKRLYNSVMVRGAVVIANSQFIADHIRKNFNIRPSRIVVIPRGADLAGFDPAHVNPEAVADLRAGWRLKGEPRIILLPGRLTSWKGQEVLIAAAEILRRRERTGFVCVLMGDPQGRKSYVKTLRRLISGAGLHDLVKIVPHNDDMRSAYALADIVVSASTRAEAFGRIAIEAQAMQKPVIVTDHGGARETVVDGITGWRVPPGDAPALADRIEQILDMDADQRANVGREARDYILAHYSVDIMCKKTLNLYVSLVNHWWGKTGTYRNLAAPDA